MAFGIYFQPTGFTAAVYDNVVKQLEQAGAGFGNVPGRRFHCAMQTSPKIVAPAPSVERSVSARGGGGEEVGCWAFVATESARMAAAANEIETSPIA